MNTWGDSLKALFYGPGWHPGSARLGDHNSLPENVERPKYNPKLPSTVEYYFIVHFFILLYVSQLFAENFAVSK